jgi:hypothetical protein
MNMTRNHPEGRSLINSDAPLFIQASSSPDAVFIQAVGKVLSNANIDKLTTAHGLASQGLNQIKDVLIAAGSWSEDQGVVSASANPDLIQAAREGLIEGYQRSKFYSNLKILWNNFSSRYRFIHEASEEELKEHHEGNSDRASIISGLIADMGTLLLAVSKEHPGPAKDPMNQYMARDAAVYDSYMGMSAATADPPTEIPPSPTPLPSTAPTPGSPETAPTQPATSEPAPTLPNQNPTEIAPESLLDITPSHTMDLNFESPLIMAKGNPQVHENLHPIRLCLFKVDEVSDTAPSMGSPLPLLITKDAVLKAIGYGTRMLPLDADPSLCKHADDRVCGVIESVGIEGNECFANAYLFAHNQPEKTQAIIAAQKDLGASINARAYKGEVVSINGKQVYRIDDLKLLGANILFKKLATYQTTGLTAAQSLLNNIVELKPLHISASGNGEDDGLMVQLSRLTDSVRASQDKHDTEIRQLREQVSELGGIVKEFAEERKRAENERIAAASAEQKASEQNQFIQGVLSALEPKFQEINTRVDTIQASVKRRGGGNQPERITTSPGTTPVPLAAGASFSNFNDPKQQLEFQLFQLGRQIEQERDPTQRAGMLTQKRSIESQLQEFV